MVRCKTKRYLYFWSLYNLYNAFDKKHIHIYTLYCPPMPTTINNCQLCPPSYFNVKVHNCQVMSLLYSISRHLIHLTRHCATTERILNDVADETALFVALQLSAFECFRPFRLSYFYSTLYILFNVSTLLYALIFHIFS